jgi:serine/threonine protein kinase
MTLSPVIQGIDFEKLERSFLSGGSSAIVYLTSLPGGGKAVLKCPHKFPRRDKATEAWERESSEHLKREIEILKHLGPHPRIVHFIAACEDELLLEFQSGGGLDQYFTTHPQPSTSTILTWATELGEALAFIHERNVIHGDVSIHNILVTDQNSLVLADFAGSPFFDHRGLVRYGARYTSPSYRPESPQKQDDIFALGSVLYEISSWSRLYPDISVEDDWKIEKDYETGNFPDTSTYILGSVIRQCWNNWFEDAAQFLISLSKIQ